MMDQYTPQVPKDIVVVLHMDGDKDDGLILKKDKEVHIGTYKSFKQNTTLFNDVNRMTDSKQVIQLTGVIHRGYFKLLATGILK